MDHKEKNVQGILLEEEELDEVNGGMRIQNETRSWIEQTEGKTPNISGGGGRTDR